MNIDGLIYNGNKKDSKTIRFKDKSYKYSSTPDFIYQYDETKYIEVFGVYWHLKEYEEFYVNSYQLNGYNVFIIWETELYDNLEKTKLKIQKFFTN